MALGLSAPDGEIAGNPEEVLRALIAVAVADGADRDQWIDRLVKATGATKRSVAVNGQPRFKVLHEALAEYLNIYDKATTSMNGEIERILADAVSKASATHLLG